MRNGNYSVWYKALGKSGLGVVTMQNGRVSGSDTMVKYKGTYRVVGDECWISVQTERYAPGRLPLFQIDKLDIELHGHSVGPITSASGYVKQVPNTTFEIILVPIPDQEFSEASSTNGSLHHAA